MKRNFAAFAVLLILITCLSSLCSAVYNSELESLYSPIYLLKSLDNGADLFSQGADEKTAPAAFVKVITAITVIENCDNVDEIVTVSQQALDIVKYSGGMVTSELSVGEQLTVKQLLYCSMLQSANDATNVLAWHVSGGDLPAFIEMLNTCVKKIGCENTVLVNATGIDAQGQYTTANDMAKIIEYGMDLPVFNEIFCAKQIVIPANAFHEERTYYTGNKMMFSTRGRYYYEYVIGGKSGNTEEAGNVFASVAVKDGYSYLAVVMKGGNKQFEEDGDKFNCAILDAKEMFKWVYSNIKLKVVASTSQVVAVIDVVAGKQSDCVRLVPASDVSALVPSNADASAVLINVETESLPKKINAPVKKGNVYGSAGIVFAGEEIARVELVAAEDIDRSMPRYLLAIAKRVVTSTAFIVVASVLAVVIISYFTAVEVMYRKQKKKRLKIVEKK